MKANGGVRFFQKQIKQHIGKDNKGKYSTPIIYIKINLVDENLDESLSQA